MVYSFDLEEKTPEFRIAVKFQDGCKEEFFDAFESSG